MVGGATDWELTETGLDQAENISLALKEKLGASSGYKLYSSDMIRAKQTVEAVAKHLNPMPEYRRELREINLGSATGKSKEWLDANQIPRPDGIPWIYHRVLLDAESAEDLYRRVSVFADEIEASNDENIIVVGHGCSLTAFAARWLWLPVSVIENSLAGLGRRRFVFQ